MIKVSRVARALFCRIEDISLFKTFVRRLEAPKLEDAGRKSSIVKKGILYKWVEYDMQIDLPEHWVSLNGNRVRIVPDHGHGFLILYHLPHERYPRENNAHFRATAHQEEKAFRRATEWAREECLHRK